MSAQEKIKNIIEQIFSEEGFKSNFLEDEEVRDLIEEFYLDEFRSFDQFKKNETGNEIPEGAGKGFRERDRRKQWTGKNVRDSLTKAQKKEIDDLREEFHKAGLNLKRKSTALLAIIEIIGGTKFKNQIDRFLLKSDEPRLNGFFNKEFNKENTKDFLIRSFYNKILRSDDSKLSLLFLDAIFSKDNTNAEQYASEINIGDLFYPYFKNSVNATSDFFKNIEVEKTEKGMYNEIGYTDPKKQRNNHIPLVSIQEFAEDSIVGEYTKESFTKIIKDLELPYLEYPEENYYRKYFNNDFVNNLVSSLAREYGDDQEIKDSLRSFLSSVGYSAPEIDRYEYLFVFPSLDFSECEPEPEIAESEKFNCEEDFYEPVPADWTKADTGQIFFDSSNCSYVLSFVTNEETIKGKKIEDIQRQYKPAIAKKYIEIFGKQQTEELIKEIENLIEFKSYFVNPMPLLKVRLLTCIDKEKTQKLLEESVDTKVEEAELITYNIKTFFENMESLSQIMSIYEQKMVVDILRGNSIYYKDLNFAREGSLVNDFSNNLARLINPLEIYEFINMSFEGDKIVGIELTAPGYKKRVVTNGLPTFSNSSPQTRSRTINFIKNINEIIEYFKENRNGKYDVFVSNFFNPEPRKEEVKNNLLNYANGAQQPINAAKFGDIAKRSLDFVASEVKRGYTSFSCLTEEEREKLKKKADSDEELKGKNKFGNQLKNQIEDRFFSEVPDVFRKISEGEGKKALNELGRDFLNRLGVCGVGDIVSLAASSIMAFMDPQEYMNELVKCAISKMDPESAKKFYNKVNSSQALNNLNQGTNFLNTYRNFVGDTLLPWDSTSLDTPSTVDALDVNALSYLNSDALEDYNLRINAFANSIAVSFDTEQLLDLLKNVPGGEWIRFFIELSDSIIRECKIVNDGDGLITNLKLKKDFRNFCEKKKDKKQKIEKAPKQKSKKKKNISEEIALNAKEIVINLVVKLIVLSFRELMSQASAALAFDVNFYKQGEVLPDFFQNREYFYDIIRETSDKASISNKEINQLFIETLEEMEILEQEDLQETAVKNFLENSALVLDQKQKLDLLKGQPSQAAIKNMLEASTTNGVSRILKDDPSKIGDIFEKFAENVNVNDLEEKAAEELEDSNVDSFFCLNENDKSYQEALVTNKGLTEEEAQQQRDEQLEREKEKLCNLTNLISNPISPIFGNALKNLFSKDGPIFGLLEEEKFKIFKDQLEAEFSLLSIPFSSDLYNARNGFLELMLRDLEGTTKTKAEFKASSTNGTAYSSFSAEMKVNTGFKYNPDISQDSYQFKFQTKDQIKLKERKDGENRVLIGTKEVSNYIVKFDAENLTEQVEKEVATMYDVTGASYGSTTVLVDEITATLNRTASNMFRTLGKVIDVKEENELDKENKISEIIEKTMPDLIERYYGNIKREMLQSRSFTYTDWDEIYPFFEDNEKISDILDIPSLVEQNLLFYQKLEDDDRIGKRKKLIYESPFDMVMTKEDYIRSATLSDLLIRTYTLEYIFKSLFGFRTFSERFFEDLDMISNYIIREMRSDLKDKDYRTFANLSMQVYLTKISLGIQEVVNEDALRSLSSLQENLDKFRSAEKEDIDGFIDDNKALIEDLIADYSEQSIKSTIKSFRETLSASNLFLDQFILGPLVQEGSIKDVVPNVKISADFPEIDSTTRSVGGISYPMPPSDYKQTRIIVERFIKIKEKENIPFSLESEIQDRSDWLFNIVNLNSWDIYLKAYDLSSYEISDLWDSWEFGLRISYVMPKMFEKEEITLQERQDTKAYNVIYNNRETSLVPMVEITREIPNQKVPRKISDQFDLSCLIYDLSQSKDYKFLFTEIIDIETLISLLTIYSVENFAEFLVVSGSDPKNDLKRWLKKPESFTNMKKSIIDILEDI